MLGIFSDWSGSTGFLPHGYCFVWTPSLLWIDVASDIITAASYLSIPFALWYFAQKRSDLPFRWIFLMFGVFVLACGSTHLFAAWNIWHADYWPEAVAKAVTAAASMTTALFLWPLMPKALAIPSRVQLENANRDLRAEVIRREQAESALQLVNQALERRVAERIAEISRSNDLLRESEVRFRSLAEMSSDFYWESDAEHRLTARGSASNKPSTISAFKRGAQIGERRWEIPYVSPTEAVWQAHRALLDSHQPFRNFEFSRLGSDGTERFISISGDPIFDASGAFKGYRGVGTDFTERKRAEEAARTNENRLRVALSKVDMAAFQQDRTLRYTWMYHPQLGYLPEEVINRTDAELLPEEAARRVTELKQRALDTGEVVHAEIAVAAKEATHYFELTAEPLRDTSDAIVGLTGVTLDITERKRAEQVLRESGAELRAIFDGALDGILVADSDTRTFLKGNTAICSMLGYTQEEIVRLGVSDIHPAQDLPRVVAHFDRVLHGDIGMATEMPVTRKDGSVFYADIKAATIRMGTKECVLGIFHDCTERRAAEAQIRRLTQLYATLSQCNQAIVRCATEEELFAQICRSAVEYGSMKMAWIGFIDPQTRLIQPIASYDDRANDYLHGINISSDAETPLGRGPTGTAFRENQPVWCQDFQNDQRTAPWRERGMRFGWRASAALPLRCNGVPVGVLTLYSGEVGTFDEAVQQLLIEMATDISFALDNFAREAARNQAQKELLAAEEQFRGLVEQSIAGIYIIQDGKLVYVNPRAAEIVGQGSADELIGTDPLAWVVETDRGQVAENMRVLLSGEAQNLALDFGALRRDGVVIEVGANAARATHKGQPAIIGLLQDISEKKRADEQIRHYIEQLQTAFMSTVEVATALSEMRDPYTAGHERRVGKIAAAIGAELGLDDQRIEGLRVAGYLHDIGKITIPAEILSKPGKLSPIEYQLIKGHPQSGYDVLKSVEFPWPVAQVTLQHHERMDGSGYPQGIKGEAILFEARIMAVADVIEAMSSHRPYRPGLGIDKALAEIERGRGTAYDADAVDACLRLFHEKSYELPA